MFIAASFMHMLHAPRTSYTFVTDPQVGVTYNLRGGDVLYIYIFIYSAFALGNASQTRCVAVATSAWHRLAKLVAAMTQRHFLRPS